MVMALAIKEEGINAIYDILFSTRTATSFTFQIFVEGQSQAITPSHIRTEIQENKLIRLFRYTNNSSQSVKIIGYRYFFNTDNITLFEGTLNIVVPAGEQVTLKFEVELTLNANTESAIPISSKSYQLVRYILRLIANDFSGGFYNQNAYIEMLDTNNSVITEILTRDRTNRKMRGSHTFTSQRTLTKIRFVFVRHTNNNWRDTLAEYDINYTFNANDVLNYVFSLEITAPQDTQPPPAPNPPQ